MEKEVEFKKFNSSEHETWKLLYAYQEESRRTMIIPEFQQGLEALGITGEGIPSIEEVNARLKKISGFRAVPVEGYEETHQFFDRLARRQFPVGNFIREKNQLSYTPAPDVFHDLYGHVPFLAWPEYADFCSAFGALAMRYKNNPSLLRQCDRLFWFTIEFGLIESTQGTKIFGAGIASSFAECRYALSCEPEVIPFDLNKARFQEFRIDEMQPRLFLLKNSQQLFNSLKDFEILLASG